MSADLILKTTVLIILVRKSATKLTFQKKQPSTTYMINGTKIRFLHSTSAMQKKHAAQHTISALQSLQTNVHLSKCVRQGGRRDYKVAGMRVWYLPRNREVQELSRGMPLGAAIVGRAVQRQKA